MFTVLNYMVLKWYNIFEAYLVRNCKSYIFWSWCDNLMSLV